MKKTVIIHSNFSKLLTGFGRTSRTLFKYLHKTGRYNLVEAANGLAFDAPECSKLPWVCHGTAPDQNHINFINNNADKKEFWTRAAGYGYFGIDKIVSQYKPDVIFQMEDYWSVFEIDKKPWFYQTTPVLWTTADSVPFQNEFIDLAGKYKNLYVWASFAEKEFARKGYSHVKTLHGCIDEAPFFPLSDEKRYELRKKFKIDKETFIFGTCSRNQLRKGFPYILDALAEYKKKNPAAKIKAFIHTSFQEGFNLPFLAKEKGINPEDLLATYYCPHCKQYEVKPYQGNDLKCSYCGGDKVNTPSIVCAPDDDQLNEIYNLFDLVVHPANSGGLEYVCLEAKLCGVPVCTTNYSYGEDAVGHGTGGFALDWEPYTEVGSNFTKAAVKVSSILEHLDWFYKSTKEERSRIGEIGRNYVINNYSINVIGPKIEAIIDAAPFADWENFDPRKNPSHQPPPNLSPQEFVIDLFTNVLKERVDKNNSQVKFWTEHLQKTNDFQGTYNHFVNQARAFNAQLDVKQVDFGSFLNPDDEKRLLICMPESAGDVLMVNSLVPNIRRQYPEFAIYFATKPQFKPFVEHLDGVTWLEYIPAMDDIFWLTGRSDHKGYFDIAFLCQGQTQRANMAYQFRRENLRPEWLNSSYQLNQLSNSQSF